MTLTGSYVQDREDYPLFWDHDIPLYLNEKAPLERTVSNTVAEIKKRQAREGDGR